MKPVLIGDDGSEFAAPAVTWARSFASQQSRKLVALSVVTGAGQSATTDETERLTVFDRHPASAIMETAENLDAALIVLGRRGAGGFPSLPLGTTAHVVAGSCGRPVVVVPPSYEAKDPLVREIVVGVDGLGGSEAALAWAARLFPDAHFLAVHALDLAPALAYMEDGAADVYERAYSRVIARIRDQWCHPLVEAGASFEVRVDEGGAAEVLLESARSTAADLVVVGRREHGALRGTLGGVSQRVLAYAPCPAAIIAPYGPTPGTRS
jgi:nucleotide-binding universal stress UspA family protein